MTLNPIIETDVLIVGAGPAGLMLACTLCRLGIKTKIIDERPTETSQGKADGLQPKTLETFDQLDLLNKVSDLGVKIYDITFWKQKESGEYYRAQREEHFPSVVDLRRPYILLTHQGVVERMFMDDILLRNLKVDRNCKFQKYQITDGPENSVLSSLIVDGGEITVKSKYVVGADGAHSQVRKSMPNSCMIGESSDSCWGVIDGELDTNFPDIWNKAVINSNEYGSVLGIPRERNLTRLYIELQRDLHNDLTEENKKIVQDAARKVVAPFKLEWNTVEWFGIYKVGQRVASSFNDQLKVFIVGDASHTHSPKAAQGMNVSMHDSWNLGWKLAHVIRGYSKEAILETYELERKKIAQDLIDFDKEHAKAFDVGDQIELAKNFAKNVRFISGQGAEYNLNMINQESNVSSETFAPGKLPVPSNVIRLVDSNPVKLESDIPILGQFSTYFIVKKFDAAVEFLEAFSDSALKSSSYSKFLSKSSDKERNDFTEKDLINKKRYTPVSKILTVSLVTTSTLDEFDLSALPSFFKPYRWSVYQEAENGPSKKWLPKLEDDSTAIVILRPDGYVSAISAFDRTVAGAKKASQWYSEYFSKF
ncbi:unnamed protein product [Kuraishia capsulata CBS 1993]|uniref:FAD-binding domain-containing protein n=1 Tax=Kuraishia capsulata CBS 1993 TaxID=1382522 RepID=W6MHW2_9ASCO|nr:uncharacterized protein KUCA_T00001372001 [Kuraishia capsulata CBS 1993]CDK25403.1 unnamed protein product [Kuraishia capsulata CBS 1993]